MSERVARSGELVARGFAVATVARVMQISRQALHSTPTPRRSPQRRPPFDAVERAIVEEAPAQQTDGYRTFFQNSAGRNDARGQLYRPVSQRLERERAQMRARSRRPR